MGNNNIYNNINTQSSSLGIKSSMNTGGSAQQKFLSKSPNQQNKLMANTNYGKFKAIPTSGQMAGGVGINGAYARGQGGLTSNNG